MNEAFLMKIWWNLINKLDELWCKVLLGKYGRNNDLMVSCSSQPYDSHLWRALVGISKDFQCHVFWKIGDGRLTNFWMDKWVPNGGDLFGSASQSLIDNTLSVRDTLNAVGDWNLDFLCDNLPINVVNQVLALPAPDDADGSDIMCNSPGPFSTYLVGNPGCHLTIFSTPLSSGVFAFRGNRTMYPRAVTSWDGEVPVITSLRSWIFNNIKKSWNGIKDTIYIGWKKSPEGWIKLNCDGACKGRGESSGCGGLFRNSDGRWMKGYSKKIGVYDAFHAEF
ncbi:hypothetical protein TSUD_19090 [Trifolium subterraneum]|uniref:RNase H type-1 domain-containing protein n=1 Tax=Trifolium subterraneum TaxID=3900 RepID=A0A2Z6MFL2_TRISU|nr:hypothetical protein TSUD_19090 [Trifolium subterraneum]